MISSVVAGKLPENRIIEIFAYVKRYFLLISYALGLSYIRLPYFDSFLIVGSSARSAELFSVADCQNGRKQRQGAFATRYALI